MTRDDHGSTTEHDAQRWEARRAEPDTDAPTLAECDRDEAEIGEYPHDVERQRDHYADMIEEFRKREKSQDAIRERLTAEVRGIRFRVEVACDGYAALTESDVPDEYGGYRAYIGGAADAARAIREALNGGTS